MLAAAVRRRSAPAGPGTPFVEIDLGPGDLNDIVWTGSQFVIVGANERIFTSPDGLTPWTLQTLPPPGGSGTISLRGVCFGGGQYVAVGHNPSTTTTVVTSPDAVTWTRRTSPVTQLADVTFGAGMYVSLFASGGPLFSADAITWTLQAFGPAMSAGYGVHFANARFMAATQAAGGDVFTSPDGMTPWAQSATDTGTAMRDSVFDGVQHYVVGNGQSVYTTPDGGVLTLAHTSLFGALQGVAFGAGRVLAVGNDVPAALALYSDDSGATWLPLAVSAPSNTLHRVAYGAGRFVAVGSGGAVRVLEYP